MKSATLALCLAGTCAAAPFPAGPGIAAGESLTYRVSWGLFNRAGEINIAAREVLTKEAAPPGLHIVTTTATRGLLRSFYPFDGEAVLIFSDREGRLQQAEARTRAGQRHTHASLLFDHAAGEARYTDHLDAERSTTLDLPEEDPLDFITSLIQVRHWDIALGESRPTYVLFDDEIYSLLITADAIETFRTPDGPRRALRLTPTMVGEPRGLFRRGGEIRVWISMDEQRLPLGFEVRMRVGTARATLTAYTLEPRVPPVPAPRVALKD